MCGARAPATPTATGYGKYGYGLPSASVSQCFRVEVYSKVPDESWAKSYLDVEEISQGKWTDMHRINTPKEIIEEPPGFVIDHLKEQGRWPLDNGTVIVWEKLDSARVDRQRREELRNRLVSDLGVIYRNVLVNVPMTVDGVKVEPCDPLFLTPGFRYYDLDDDRAEELPPADVDITDKASKQSVGKLRVRFSRMPASFFRKPEAKQNNKPSRHDMNERLPIADAHNGIIFLRNGRQIDVVKPPKRFYSVNATTDRFWAIEVDFDATLDDEFSMTTAKQQVVPSDRIWNMLNDKAKIFDSVAAMKSAYNKEAAKIRTEAEARKKASIEALEDAAKFRTSKQPQDTPARRKEAADNLKNEARRRARSPASRRRRSSANSSPSRRASRVRSRPRTCRVPRSSAAFSVVGSACCCSTSRTPSIPTCTPDRVAQRTCAPGWSCCSGPSATQRSMPIPTRIAGASTRPSGRRCGRRTSRMR